jgi:hypothetical protein
MRDPSINLSRLLNNAHDIKWNLNPSFQLSPLHYQHHRRLRRRCRRLHIILLRLLLLLLIVLYIVKFEKNDTETASFTHATILHESQYNSYYPTYSNKTNAIIYLAQKSHKVYLRDSFEMLQRSLDLLFEHYLLIHRHYRSVTVFIFHTGDFTNDDLQFWEQSRYPSETRGTIQLINLKNTPYWETPSNIREQDLSTWHNPNFNLGYRHM